MAKEFNQAHAAALWNLVGVTIDNVRVAPRQHKGNVTFIGYADIQVWLFTPEGTIPFLTLCGNSIKLINEGLHFDPKSERGKGNRSGDFFPIWLPSGGASRALLTKKLAENAGIQEMVAQATAMLAETAKAAS